MFEYGLQTIDVGLELAGELPGCGEKLVVFNPYAEVWCLGRSFISVFGFEAAWCAEIGHRMCMVVGVLLLVGDGGNFW